MESFILKKKIEVKVLKDLQSLDIKSDLTIEDLKRVSEKIKEIKEITNH